MALAKRVLARSGAANLALCAFVGLLALTGCGSAVTPSGKSRNSIR